MKPNFGFYFCVFCVTFAPSAFKKGFRLLLVHEFCKRLGVAVGV